MGSALSIDARLAVATCLAVELTIRSDPQPDSKLEFRRVQMAKQIHRMTSGTDKRWPKRLEDQRNCSYFPGLGGRSCGISVPIWKRLSKLAHHNL